MEAVSYEFRCRQGIAQGRRDIGRLLSHPPHMKLLSLFLIFLYLLHVFFEVISFHRQGLLDAWHDLHGTAIIRCEV